MLIEKVSSAYLQVSTWFQDPLLAWSREPKAVLKFSWDHISAHRHFDYQPCFGDFQCARLEVPMDWLGGSAEAEQGKTVEIAVAKLEASVPVTDSNYGGAVVLNPGGPGGSGIEQVLSKGHHFRTLLSAGPHADNRTAKYFDIIGFDPRGVNHTRPFASCFTDHLARSAAEMEERGFGLIGTSDTSFNNIWTLNQAISKGCSKRLTEQGLAKHMSTAPVARDIVEIFERHGEWREKEAKRLLSSPQTLDMSDEQRSGVLARTAYKPAKERIQYWGLSYGTILGATLAALFPDRIYRALLDGVADSHDYSEAVVGGWTSNLYDTDGLFSKLAEYCFTGGPENCAIYDERGPTTIAAQVQNTIESLHYEPIPVPENSVHGPMIVTHNDLKLVFREAVYNPLLYFPSTAQILHDLSNRNGTSLAHSKISKLPDISTSLSRECLESGPYHPSCFPLDGASVEAGITCSDAYPGRINQSRASYREYADSLRSQSSLLGEWWASIQMYCVAWDVKPHWRYEGDFRSKTAHPLLFAGNTLDPVTPLRNAFLMAEGFEDAAVLHQNSEGHCTLASLSMCSGRAVRRYFQSGEVPGEERGSNGWNGVGAKCEPDRVPFDGYTAEAIPEAPEGEDDVALWKALVELNR